MKLTSKSKIVVWSLILLAISLSIGVYKHREQARIMSDDSLNRITRDRNNLGSQFEGNYVWGGAMNLAWNELTTSIIKEPIRLQTTDQRALDIVTKLNNPAITIDDLDEKSYFIKSGYGQSTVNAINKESRQKFPGKSFEDVDLKLSPLDIISYAYFFKEVEYPTEFKETTLKFMDKPVKGFKVGDNRSRENIRIIKYWSDDKFILSFKLKQRDDQLIVAKGFEMSDPASIVNEIVQYPENEYTAIGKDDFFSMPNIHMKFRRDFTELSGTYLANTNFTKHRIAHMFENIAFELNHKGAYVENEAVIELTYISAQQIPEDYKRLVLDKPFWVIMKRLKSNNPYFILGINNDKLMEKVSAQGEVIRPD